MRIAVDGLLLWGNYSGVERAIARFAEALPRVAPQHEWLLVLPRDGKSPGDGRPNLRILRAPFDGRQKLRRILWQQGVMPFLLHREGADALFAPGYVMPLRWQGPSVLFIYDVIALARPELAAPANVRHYGLVLPRAARRATHIAVPSAHVRAQVVDWCHVPPAKVSVVPLGVDGAFRPVTDASALAAVRERLHLPERFLLYVGNLEPKKNLGRLLEAFALVRRAGVRHKLVLAGAPAWGAGAVQAAIEAHGLAGEVLPAGYVPDADLPALYTLADLFLFPSLTEGFGLPPLEAMACGTPALVGDVPPFPETVGDAALRVPPHDPEVIAAGILRGLRDEELRARLRAAGRERAGRFTWEAAARKVVRLLGG